MNRNCEIQCTEGQNMSNLENVYMWGPLLAADRHRRREKAFKGFYAPHKPAAIQWHKECTLLQETRTHQRCFSFVLLLFSFENTEQIL